MSAEELVEMGRDKRKWLPPLGRRPLGPHWAKRLPADVRRRSLTVKTAEVGCRTVLATLQALSNVTRDKATKKLMLRDRAWLRKQNFCHLKTKRR